MCSFLNTENNAIMYITVFSNDRKKNSYAKQSNHNPSVQMSR